MTDKSQRLVVVSNRVADFTAKFQTGGLAVALGDALKASHGLWFGWSGDVTEDAATEAPKVETVSGLTVATIDLTPEEAEGYYYGYANRCLWPSLHYRLDLAQCNEEHNEIYFNVSVRFADALMPLINKQIISIGELMVPPLAAELGRAAASIGFSSHTPFPSPEIFAAVPGQKRLGNALIVYDAVGFQTCADRDNFRRYVAASLDGEQLEGDRLAAQGETTLASAFPIGIDAAAFRKLAESESEKGPVLPDLGDEMKTIIGIDRLDYTKGLPDRLRAFEMLLEEFPEHRGKVRLVQVAPATRDSLPVYQTIREEVEHLVGRINGRFGDMRWTPIRYLHRGFPQDILIRLYRQSAVGLVTPLRDGMNLVAKEYIAAQAPEDPGVLVLSRFAGAAEQLREALLVNPHDIHEMARALDRALTMPRQERWARHNRLWQCVETFDLANWRDNFIQSVASSDTEPGNLIPKKQGAA